MTHKHFWRNPYVIYEGLKYGEAGIVRYCTCGNRQMGFVNKWQKPPKEYDVATMSKEDLESL